LNHSRSTQFTLLLLLSCLISGLIAGCAQSKWAPVLTQNKEISWPAPPKPTKVSYLGTVNHFEQTNTNLLTAIFGQSRSGKIGKPVDIAVGSDGRIAVADQGYKGIHLYLPDSEQYIFLTGDRNTPISSPVALTFDDLGNLYATDSLLESILVFDPNGETKQIINMAGDSPVLRPTGITYDPTNKLLYVSDTMRHQILIYETNGNFVGHIGSRGQGTSFFNFPTHLTIHKENIYITDSMNFRAQIIAPATGNSRKFGTHGNAGGDFASPKGIAVDSDSTIYIAETLFDSIQLFNQEGQFLLNLGSQGSEQGQFWMLSGIFIDKHDILYVCDTYNKRIQKFQLITSKFQREHTKEKDIHK